MTAITLLDNALALLATTRALSPEYVQYALPLINILLAETAPYDNSIRAAKGLAEAQDAPEITALSDTLPAQPELCAAALAYGLCARLLLNEDDMARMAYFNNAYISALEDAARFVPAAVTDVYGGDAQ
ncbi:MAG: hypothetical protein VB092_06190 [Oscillospiraceae bacterium]|nr:hypothetical protein [Oscillospiraceae bacterium]